MAIVDTITNLLGGSITDGIAKIIQLFKVDPTVALQKQTEVAEIQLKMQSDAAAAIAAQLQGQLDINKAEASSGNWFAADWRPAIGYICGLAMLNNFILAPWATWLSGVAGHPIAFPVLPTGDMMPVLLGMLGLSAGHVYENTRGAGK
jgi:hypothetical protein